MSTRHACSLFAFAAAVLTSILGVTTALAAATWTVRPASDGTMTVRHTNGTGHLQTRTTGSNLHFYNVRGCAGIIKTGDSATISATYTMTPIQAITSP